MTTTAFLNWLYQLSDTSPAYYIFNFLIQTTIYLSITAIFILLFKLIFKNKIPAKLHVAIWVLLLIRFVVPALPESPVSVFNAARVSEESVRQASYQVIINEAPVEIAESSVTEVASTEEDTKTVCEMMQHIIETTSDSSTSSGTIIPIDTYVSVIWAVGSGIMIIYFLIIYIIYTGRLRKSRRECKELTLEILKSCKTTLKIKRNLSIYYADTSPMLIGIFRPTLYLPDTYSDSEVRDVILHELCHMKNFDIPFTMLATLLLCLNWFNPIIWISFFVFKRDIEVFCDERTLRYSADKQNYARLLLKTATSRKEKFVLGTTSLQSGKADVKRRIKYMAFFKKPAELTVVAVIFAVLIISACCLTNSVNYEYSSSLTFENPVTDGKLVLFVDNSVIEPSTMETNFLYRETNATMDEIYTSIALNNPDIRIEQLSEKELLIHHDNNCPYILISKNVTDTSGKEIDNVVVLMCIGEKANTLDYNESNMPNIEYSYYFPVYLIDNYFVYNTSNKSMESHANANPFVGEVKLKDSYTNFSQMLSFYRGLQYSIDEWGNDLVGGEILVQDEYSDMPLYSIYYDEKNRTVKYEAYPALAADSAKSVIYKYFNAIKNHDVETYARCFEDSRNLNDRKSELDKIYDVTLDYIEIKGFDNEKMQYTYDVVYDIVYSDDYNKTHIESQFVVNINNYFTPIITNIKVMETET